MNEATFEARLNDELQRIFPTLGKLEISYQDIFTLHFGHKSITINGRENDKAFGRYDVLIKIDEKPVILFELKRPGRDLVHEDRDQGISYARLLDSMPPLVVISNGEQTEIYTTYDKKQWETAALDEKTLEALIKQSLSCAATDKDNAVKLLLGQQPWIWTDIIRQFTAEKLSSGQGYLRDLAYPLAKDFSIPRKISFQTAQQLIKGHQLIALVGPPLSGKSNVVAQLCGGEDKSLVPIYIDGGSLHYGVLQYLANIFAHDLFRAASSSEIRHWLLSGLRNPVDGRLVIIIDGWSSDVSDQIRDDIEEIIDICRDSAVSILLATDEYAFASIVAVPGRPTKTEIGKKIVKLTLEPLDDEEFEVARKYFVDRYRVFFHHGSQFNEEYRYPRILRIIAAQVSAQIPSEERFALFIPSVTSVNFLNFTWEAFATDPVLRVDLRKLAQAFANDKPMRDIDPSLSLVSHGRGFITYETAERELGNERLTRLLSQGHLVVVNFKADQVLIIPRVPELLASAASYFVAGEILALLAEGNKDSTYEYLIRKTSSFPYGNIVAAIAIIEVTKQAEDFLTYIVPRLVKDPPRIEKLSKNSRFLVDVPNMGTVPIQGEKLSEGNIIGNIDPWLILSHLADIGLASQDGSRDVQLGLYYEVGDFPYILRRPDSISTKIMKGFHVHELPGIGEILCHQTGLIEPITQAMMNSLYDIPVKMIELCRHAIEKKKWALFWRLYTVANATETCAEPEVAKSSREIIRMYDSIKDALFKDIVNACNNEPMPSKVEKKKSGRNAPCPCGSGKKYKRCCGKV